MREVNFSLPNGNKASVYITATLYDRRALDCTSTLPLITSLNHLAYLTTSSARIRDILTVDGGVERLICMLKEGRSKDDMHMWKWNLAFQCIVNIGVRGTELVRSRVVEADMVPVIATILHDYSLVADREKQKQDSKKERHPAKTACQHTRSSHRPREPSIDLGQQTSFLEHRSSNSESRSRRQAPPPALEIPQSFTEVVTDHVLPPQPPITAPLPRPAARIVSPSDRSPSGRPPLPSQYRSHDGRSHQHRGAMPGPSTAVPSMEGLNAFGLRPVRDADRLPSMMLPPNSGVTSNPDSPTTPLAPVEGGGTLSPTRRRGARRPSIRQLSSTDDIPMEDVQAVTEDNLVEQEDNTGRRRPRSRDGDLTPRAGTEMEFPDRPMTLSIQTDLPQEGDTIDIAQQTPTATNALDMLLPVEQEGVSPALVGAHNTLPANVARQPFHSGFVHSQNLNLPAALSAIVPREDDVLMGLQLLAYISKYCDLRHFFQNTHLVPKLRIDRDVEAVYGPLEAGKSTPEPTEEEMEEYLQADDVNIFPLVEKFTVPHHSKDMQYWACVVMRNLCRKDDKRNGTRQCANYKCGKWEDFPRQFAKCRRCKRTKYCSKECQRDSWSMHRHWCQNTP